MGADGSAYVVLGFEVTRTTFFVTKKAGIKCPKGHRPTKPTSKFCDECGGRFAEAATEEATPDFAAWAERLGHSPDDVWEMLNEYEGGIDIGAGKKNAKFYAELGIHHVGAIESSEEDTGHTALGFKLFQQESERGRGPSVNVCSLPELTEKAVFLETLAKELKVEFALPPQLFLTFYWSV
jgi:hypothetical protein